MPIFSVGMIDVKVVAAIAGIVALGAVGTTTLASPTDADSGTWAAFAVSVSTHVKGLSWGYPIGSGPGSAVARRAVQECANHPLHPADCMWLQSARCVAFTQSSEFCWAGYGFTREDAERDSQKLPHGASELGAAMPQQIAYAVKMAKPPADEA